MAARYAIYDPLSAQQIDAEHAQSAQTYWQHSAPELPAPALNSLPSRAPWVIIGAGYTGLNAAIELACRYQQEVVVLEASHPGAGCSSRNAGFILPTSGRLSLADYATRYGGSVADAVATEFSHSIQHVGDIIAQHAIDCDFAPARYLRIAHNRQHASNLQQLAEQATGPWSRDYISAEVLQQRCSAIQHAYGALVQQPAARVNPAKLVAGYAKVAQQLGVRIYGQHPVQAWTSQTDGEHLSTPQGRIVAEQVLLCSNAYMPHKLLPQVSRRQLPALSSILVTAPLSAWQVDQLGLTENDLVMDTRALKYYYRLLPDRRLLFGGRGAVSGKDAQHPRYQRHLEQAMYRTLPVLKGTATEYCWSGWVSASFDAMPHIYRPQPRVSVSMGYCGAGVAFAALAGKRMAQQAMGETLPALPFYHSVPPTFPMPALRRMGQRLYYHYARCKDAL